MNLAEMFGPQPKLGRVIQPDPRDGMYQASRRLSAAEIVSPPVYKYWHVPEVMDQGNTSHCVGFGCGYLLESGPVTNDVMAEVSGAAAAYCGQIYREAQLRDDWEGEEPLYYGTSVRAGLQVIQDRGFITRYSWAWDLDTIIGWLGAKGPVVMGTDWYEGMWGDSAASARTGFVETTGRIVGGHCWMIKGYNLEKKCPDGSRGAVRMVNSWGAEWMQGGYAWLSLAMLSKLLDNWAEAAMCEEIKFLEAEG